MGFDVGQRVADYRIEGVLAYGGTSPVYLVCDVRSGRAQTMKVLLSDVNAEPELASRFHDQIRILAGFSHPNIAQVQAALEHNNKLWIITEFVEGCTLRALVHQAALSPEKASSYVQQVLVALGYAHHRGVVHRDINPANIVLAPQGVVKLVNFGFAELPDETTAPGSDIYSLGISFLELLTGQLPRSPIEIDPHLAKPLSDLIMKALEKDPEQRLQTAGEFSDRLGEVTGVSAANAVLIAGGFSEVMSIVPGVSGTWIAPAAALAASASKRQGPSIGAVAAALVLMGLTAAGVSSWMKGGLTAKYGVRSISQSSPARDSQPIATDMPAAEIAGEKETAIASVLAAAKVDRGGPTLPPAGPIAPKLLAVPYRAAAPPRSRSEAGQDSLSREAAAPQRPEPEAIAKLPVASTAELQEVRRQKDELNVRASALRSQMARLRNQKIIDGHDLNQGMADAYVDMNQSLRAGSADLDSGNAAAARSHMEQAALAVNVLEKLFSQNP